MSKRLIQLTLTPEEAVWLYCAMAAGHHLALALGAEVEQDISSLTRERAFARQQGTMAAEVGCAIDFLAVAHRLERLINSCKPEQIRVQFVDDHGNPR